LPSSAGPQQISSTFDVTWQMYNWTCIDKDGKFLDSNKHWIWGEGIPTDVAPFVGDVRILFLVDAQNAKTPPAKRTFEPLRASLKVKEELQQAEVEQWMKRIANVSEDIRQQARFFILCKGGMQ
jgi:hypothetical protein